MGLTREEIDGCVDLYLARIRARDAQEAKRCELEVQLKNSGSCLTIVLDDRIPAVRADASATGMPGIPAKTHCPQRRHTPRRRLSLQRRRLRQWQRVNKQDRPRRCPGC